MLAHCLSPVHMLLLSCLPASDAFFCSDEFCPLREVGESCARGYGATTGFFFLGLAITSLLNMITSAKSLQFLCGKFGFRCFAPAPESEISHRNPSVHGDGAEDGCDAGTSAASEPSPLQPEAQPLPPGWEVKVTIGSMKPFFYHPGSKQYSWDFPGLQGASHCPCHNSEIEMSSTDIKTSAQDRGLGVTCAEGTDGVLVQVQEPDINTDLERNHPEVDEQARLNATGLLTGLAIAIHNFPEGLATFVAAMADPSLGAAIAVAIAIHNVPEGVCVAMPIYYATGSRTRAFLWATLSGVSEPIGALFGWAVLGGDVSNMAYGSMFGIVAGTFVCEGGCFLVRHVVNS